jgi:signal transduction histidine kinase
VAELARAFNRSADQIQILVQSQRRMLASASHELRSPLARVRVALELLPSLSPAEQGPLLQEAALDIQELDSLIADLLLAGRLGAPEPLQKQVVELLALAAEEASRTHAELSGAPTEVQGDPKLLRRLIRNLLENADRHGAPPVELHIGPGPRLEVRDRGPGVPDSERERIFEAFYRPAGHREGEGGVGLGLALVRQIADAHGGQVRCLPREGGGSVFQVILA